jgi:hypothetical protein
MILIEITSDPKKSEFSNARIEGPAKTFQATKKLIESVRQLETELREGEYDYYRAIAELLTDVQEQMSKFTQYVALPHIALIQKKIEAIESELRRQVQWSFREIGALTSSEKYEQEQDMGELSWNMDVSPLDDVYLVIDALGEKFRLDLLERFAQLQLIPYEKLFKLGTKYCALEFLEQRFAWFRYLLRIVDSKLSDIFPSKYKIGYHLFIEFSRRSKKHIGDVLSMTEKDFNVQQVSDEEAAAKVGVLLKAIKCIMGFEAEIMATFDIKERFDSSDDSSSNKTKVIKDVPESIRDAFDPYLGPYVQLERKGLEDIMVAVMRNEESTQTLVASTASNLVSSAGPASPGPAILVANPGEPYESSTKLFEYIKGSLKRCMVFSTGITFLSLSKEFRIALQQYAESLKFRCPSPFIPAKNNKPAVYQLTKSTESTLCRIICTCEYCIDILPTLESIMRSKIQAAYSDEIDFSPQVDAFMNTVSFTMTILASGEVFRMENDFANMKKVNWATYDTVMDTGPYVKHMLRILGDCAPRIRISMSSSYFLNMCMKLVSTFVDAYLDNIYQLRRISKTGAGQLLLDLNSIKEYLLLLPNVKQAEGAVSITISKVYISVVNTKVKKVENILKLICTEDAMLEEMFGLLWPDATHSDIDMINTLKGNRNIISTINTVVSPLDSVGEALKSKAQNMHQGTVQGLSTGINKVKGGFKTAFGDIISGNLFNDSSTHSGTVDLSAHNSSSSHEHGYGSSSVLGGGNSSGGGLKQAVSGVTSALTFTKKPAATASSSSASSSRK